MSARWHALARRLLYRALPPHLRDAVLGDLDDEVAEHEAAGVTREQAMRWATWQALCSTPSALRLRFAGSTDTQITPRSAGGLMQSITQDVWYALRLLKRSPLFALTAIGTLAVGIGATTAIFSVAHATFLRPLAYPDADRVVRIYETFRNNQFVRGVANPTNFDHWERHATSFSDLAAIRSMSATLTGAGDPMRIRVQAVTPAFFKAIGVAPAIGRPFGVIDDVTAAAPVLLSHELWQSRFGGDPQITSRTVTLNGTVRPVIGVMPRGFSYPYETQAWAPLILSATDRANSSAWYLGTVARLKPGVTVAQAQAELNQLALQLRARFPVRQKDRGAYVVSLHEDLVYRFADGVRLLQAAVAVVLLIAVANVANLLLAHGSGRQREFSVRAAVGAGRARVMRQALTESLVLGTLGAGVGVLLAYWGVRGLAALSPIQLPSGMEPAMSAPVLLFALGLGFATSVLFGLAPAVGALRAQPAAVAREHAPSAIASARSGGGRLRSSLVVAEVALAVVLLVGAGLLLRSFRLLTAQELGFDGQQVLTTATNLPSITYRTRDQRLQFWNELFPKLRALPGVTAVGGSTAVPFTNWEWQTDFRIVGREEVPNDGAGIRTVHPGYFETLRVPLLAGRAFSEADGPGSEPVVMVNEAFVRAHLTGLDPLGQRVRLGRDPQQPVHLIVGVVGSTRHFRLENAPQAEVYRPLAQEPPQTFVLAMRVDGDPRAAFSLVRSAVHEVDPDLPVEDMATMDALIGKTVAERRFYMLLMTGFSVVSLLMSVIGVYGVMAFVVGQRTREIGIRVALGAQPAEVQRMILISAGTLIAVGLVLGTGGALAVSGVLHSTLFGVTPRDPATVAAVLLLLGGLGLAASYFPARRARRLDPIVALRHE